MTTRTIVVGLDGSAGAAAALQWARDHAADLDATVVGIHSIDAAAAVPPPTVAAAPFVVDDDLRETMRAELRRWVAPLVDAGVPTRTELYEGSPVDAIRRVAAREGADLVVVGRRGHSGLMGLLLGSVARALAHDCDVPVVIVPAEAAGATGAAGSGDSA